MRSFSNISFLWTSAVTAWKLFITITRQTFPAQTPDAFFLSESLRKSKIWNSTIFWSFDFSRDLLIDFDRGTPITKRIRRKQFSIIQRGWQTSRTIFAILWGSYRFFAFVLFLIVQFSLGFSKRKICGNILYRQRNFNRDLLLASCFFIFLVTKNFRYTMGDPTISKLQSFGFSFWICNTAIWFILFLSFTYKFQPWFLQKAG